MGKQIPSNFFFFNVLSSSLCSSPHVHKMAVMAPGSTTFSRVSSPTKCMICQDSWMQVTETDAGKLKQKMYLLQGYQVTHRSPENWAKKVGQELGG